MNRIRAFDATSGEELWMWNPRVADHSDMRVGWEHNRGIGIWPAISSFRGRVDGTFVAYDASTGETLWTYGLGLGISAPPVTCSVDGEQYVALLVVFGGGGAGVGVDIAVANGWAYGVHERRLVVFSLDGQTQLPPQPPALEAQPIPMPAFEVVHEDLAAEGAAEYGRCLTCHGFDAISPGMDPDLRASTIGATAEGFAGVRVATE